MAFFSTRVRQLDYQLPVLLGTHPGDLLYKGHKAPQLLLVMGWAEGGHTGHFDTVLYDPVDLGLAERFLNGAGCHTRGRRIEAFGEFYPAVFWCPMAQPAHFVIMCKACLFELCVVQIRRLDILAAHCNGAMPKHSNKR